MVAALYEETSSQAAMAATAHPKALVNSFSAEGPSSPPIASSALLPRRILFHPAFKPSSSTPSAFLLSLTPLNTPPVDHPHPSDGDLDHSMVPSPPPQKQQKTDEELPSLLQSMTLQRIGGGLTNLGNTCFLNSVLQCLTYTPPLAAYLLSGVHKTSCHVVGGFCAMCALENHVKQAMSANGRTISPTYIVKNLRCISRSFQIGRQEDSHEYMRYFIEALQKCSPAEVGMGIALGHHKGLIQTIFGGKLRSQVKCTQCSYCSNTYDPFLDLSLEIVRAESLMKALARFTAVEVLDGDNKYQCSKCKRKVKALKQFTIDKLPHVLTIQFKRFSNSGVCEGKKIDKKVHFERIIDMKPFVNADRDGAGEYSLYAVLVHSGWSTHSGHYFCFVRTAMDMWHMLDDGRVLQVSEKTVLEQKAYILFYVRDSSLHTSANSTSRYGGGIKDLGAVSNNMSKGKGLMRSNDKALDIGRLCKTDALMGPRVMNDTSLDSKRDQVIKCVELVPSNSGVRDAEGDVHDSTKSTLSNHDQHVPEQEKTQSGLAAFDARVPVLRSSFFEAAVPRWSEEEGYKGGEVQSPEETRVHCGYVLDEWDKEYDQGKRKKVRKKPKEGQSLDNGVVEEGTEHQEKRRKTRNKASMEENTLCGNLFQAAALSKSKGVGPRSKSLKRWSHALGPKMFIKRSMFKRA